MNLLDKVKEHLVCLTIMVFIFTSDGRLRSPAKVSEKLPWLGFLGSVSSFDLREDWVRRGLRAPGDLW